MDSGVELRKFAPLPENADNEMHCDANAVEEIVPKLGSKIRPEVTEEEAIRLAERLYGISTCDICELYGYDDKNFKIHSDP